MRWQGQALVINITKQGENNLLLTLFTNGKGVFKTIVRGGTSKKNIAILQIGNLIEGNWNSRLENQLGNLSKIGVIENHNARFINDVIKQLSLKTICDLLCITIKIGDHYDELYNITLNFLKYLQDTPLTYQIYIDYEITLLEQLGYSLDYYKCAITGETDNIFYISPNTGHCATKDAGEKFHDRLLLLPEFLKEKPNKEIDLTNEIYNSFKLTSFFLEKHLLTHSNYKLPIMRKILEKKLINDIT